MLLFFTFYFYRFDKEEFEQVPSIHLSIDRSIDRSALAREEVGKNIEFCFFLRSKEEDNDGRRALVEWWINDGFFIGATPMQRRLFSQTARLYETVKTSYRIRTPESWFQSPPAIRRFQILVIVRHSGVTLLGINRLTR